MHRSDLRLLVVGINYAPETTGIAPYTSKMAEALTSKSWDVSAITTFPHYPSWSLDVRASRWSKTETLREVKVTRKLHYVPSRPKGLRRVISELSFGFRLLPSSFRKVDARLVVSPALLSSWLFALVSRSWSRKTPLVVWVQDLYGLGMEQIAGSGFVSRALLKLETQLFTMANHVVTIHETMSAALQSKYSVPAEKITLIRNWSHVGFNPIKEPVDKTVGQLKEDFIVMHTGNMGVKQGLDNVVAAAKIAEEMGLPIKFVLVGDGSEKKALVELAGVCGNISFLPPVDADKYIETLGEADVLLVNEVPELTDMAFPSKLTSYFSSGKPVIAATNPKSATAQELLVAKAGWVVEPGQPELLVKKVMELRDKHQALREAGLSGLAHAQLELTESTAVNKMDILLRDLIETTGIY